MVKIKIERSGSLVRASAEAPKGFVWAAGFTHELIAESRGGADATADAKRDITERMKLGTLPCDDPDCDWCADE